MDDPTGRFWSSAGGLFNLLNDYVPVIDGTASAKGGNMIEKVAYGGWPDCYRVSDGKWELIVVSDVGPRAIRFGFVGGDNVFCEFEELLGLSGGSEWRVYGGHRLWHSPEAMPRSYIPDNKPADVVVEGGELRVIQPLETETGIRKEMLFALAQGRLTVTHVLRNRGVWPVTLAPWALSVMAPGGMGIIPQPTTHHPDNLLPNRTLALWPYTDMSDERLRWGARYISMRQDTSAGPAKIGLNADDGWLAYLNKDLLFVKRFNYQPCCGYPDGGCSVEMYTNERMLELETLGPLTSLEPGESVKHVERWYLFADVTLEDESEEAIDQAVRSRATSVE